MSLSPPSALAGRRVLEIADESGVYCGKLLADMGADVIKIEPPGGDATRRIPPFHGSHSLFFLYMNTSKRGVTLDLRRRPDREIFLQLARTADLVIETLPPGRLDELDLGYERLAAANAGLVLTSITGFGQTGPHRDYRSSDLVASAVGGALYVTGDPEDAPVTLAGSQAQLMASTTAAASSLIALFHARRSGHGQRIDISVQETTLAVTHICGVGKWLDDGIVPRRFGTGLFASVPSGTYRCRDGLVYLTVNRPAHWKALAEWIHEETGNEEVLMPLFEGPSSRRQEYRELLDLWISELTQARDVLEIYHEGQRRHIAITPVNGTAEVVRDAQLAAREYFVELEQSDLGAVRMPGAPYRHARTPWRLRGPAPRVGEHNREIFLGELGLAEDSLRAAALL